MRRAGNILPGSPPWRNQSVFRLLDVLIEVVDRPGCTAVVEIGGIDVLPFEIGVDHRHVGSVSVASEVVREGAAVVCSEEDVVVGVLVVPGLEVTVGEELGYEDFLRVDCFGESGAGPATTAGGEVIGKFLTPGAAHEARDDEDRLARELAEIEGVPVVVDGFEVRDIVSGGGVGTHTGVGVTTGRAYVAVASGVAIAIAIAIAITIAVAIPIAVAIAIAIAIAIAVAIPITVAIPVAVAIPITVAVAIAIAIAVAIAITIAYVHIAGAIFSSIFGVIVACGTSKSE